MSHRVAVSRLTSHFYWLVPGVIAVPAVLWGISDWSLGVDELATLSAVNRPAADTLRMVMQLPAEPLVPYYVFMRVWTEFAGLSEMALRLPSALAVAGAVIATAILAGLLHSARAGFLAGILMVLLPRLTVLYAHETRPYAIAVFLTVTATVALVILARHQSRILWIAYMGLIAAAGLSQFMTLTVLAGHGAYLIRQRRDLSRQWAVAAAIGALPGVGLFVASLGETLSWTWIRLPDLTSVAVTFPHDLVGSTALAWLLIGLGIAGWRVSSGAPTAALLWPWLVLPPVALIIASYVVHPAFSPRYVLFTIPALVVLAAIGVTRARAYTIVISLAMVLVVEGQLSGRDGLWGRPDLSGAAGHISANARDGDAIAYSWEIYKVGIEYYLEPGIHLDDVSLRQTAAAASKLLPIIRAPSEISYDGQDRVWLVQTQGESAQGDYNAGLSQFRLVGSAKFYDPETPFEVDLYER